LRDQTRILAELELVLANDGPSSFVKIVEDHFRDRFNTGD